MPLHFDPFMTEKGSLERSAAIMIIDGPRLQSAKGAAFIHFFRFREYSNRAKSIKDIGTLVCL